jgi:type VI secretion system protein ImpG
VTDPLLPYYDRELDALRRLASTFAETHPEAAGRLRLSRDAADDPHVERLLEGAAFLTARVQQRLDDDFPEITDALLGLLYPAYLAPIPSAAIARFSCRPNVRGSVHVPTGTALLTDPVGGEPCRFRTTQDVQLWPIEIEAVRLSGLPLAAPENPRAAGARGVLRVALRLTDPEARFDELDLRRLRFFLGARGVQSMRLHELLCAHTLGVALANGPNDDRPTLLPPSAVSPVGFAPDEALYPWSAQSFSGFRLLTEYFAMPDKFLFVDIDGLEARTLVQSGNRLEIFIYFDRASPDLERLLGPNILALGCTPIVNLFHRACEPIRMDGSKTEYLVLADARRPHALEVWDIGSVGEMREDGSQRPWLPFYRRGDAAGATPAGRYLTARRDSLGRAGGTDVFLLPAEAAPSASRAADIVLSVDAICTNRDLLARLPFGGGSPALHLAGGIASVSTIECLTPPTPTGRPTLRLRRNWQFISHLSLGHLSLVDGEEEAIALRQLLALYDHRGTAETRAAIEGLISVRKRDAIARVPGARTGSFCRGLDLDLVFDAVAWDNAGLFLLASVLDRFLALHTTVNSFVRTRAVSTGTSVPLAAFAARAGARSLL